jgi:hypothetical protein
MVYVGVGDNDSPKIPAAVAVRLQRFLYGLARADCLRAGVQQGQRLRRKEIEIHAPYQERNRESNGSS